MAFARFFERAVTAVGQRVPISRAVLEESLGEMTVGVAVGEQSENGTLIAEFSTNLIARFFPTLAFSGPTDTVEKLTRIARSINPKIDIASDTARAVWIGVGDSTRKCDVYAGAAGWVAKTGSNSLESGLPNPFSASAAACLAVGQVMRASFAKFLGEQEVVETQVSLLDFSKTAGIGAALPPLDVESVAFFGLGAVANSALWCLGQIDGLRGRATLVDPESVELSNLQRYVLAEDDDAPEVDSGATRKKTSLAADALARTQLKVDLVGETLEQFSDRFSDGFSVPTICVSVDSIAGRRATQALLPRLVINGWTSDSGLGASWHDFESTKACLACLYHPTAKSLSQTEMAAKALGLDHELVAIHWVRGLPLPERELVRVAEKFHQDVRLVNHWQKIPVANLYSDLVCGHVALDLTGVGVQNAVPLAFQSALAGILMAAELVKRTHRGLTALAQGETLVAWDDVLRPPPQHWTQPRPSVAGCFCSDDDYRAIFQAKWR